eukprot:2118615-Rhodomonas_salina.4
MHPPVTPVHSHGESLECSASGEACTSGSEHWQETKPAELPPSLSTFQSLPPSWDLPPVPLRRGLRESSLGGL